MQCLSDSSMAWIFPGVNSKDGVLFAMLFTLRLLQHQGKVDSSLDNLYPIVLEMLFHLWWRM